MSNRTPRKFKVWQGGRGKMHEPPHDFIIRSDGRVRHSDPIAENRKRGEWRPLFYTGLTDADDTEIYEGDIMQVGDRRALVKWRRSPNGCYLDFIGSDDTTLIGLQVDAPDGAVVIGNRYENPELLEEVSA